MSVHKNKNGTWYVKYKNKTKRGFKSKSDAKKYEARLRLQNKTNETIYFSIVVKDYIEYLEKNVCFTTYNKYKRCLENIIIPNVPNKDINDITEMDCRKFRDFIQDLKYSTDYKNYILQQYKAVFKHAKKYFHSQNNAFEIIDNFKMTFDEKIKKKNKELNIWSDDEFSRFIQNVDRYIYKVFFIMLYYTGMRLGEALALTWKDFTDNKISITKSLDKLSKDGKHIIKEPKNVSSIREIELGNTLTKLLLEYKNREMTICGYSEDWFIFGRTAPLSRTHITRIKDIAIEKANVRRIKLHDFRHSHASNLIANGVNVVAVSRRLGHSNTNMTLEIYTHLLKKSSDEALNFIEESSHNLLI